MGNRVDQEELSLDSAIPGELSCRKSMTTF